jgi:hypothetical protein
LLDAFRSADSHLHNSGQIRLAVYSEDGNRAAAVTVYPVRAIGLTAELIRSALPEAGGMTDLGQAAFRV